MTKRTILQRAIDQAKRNGFKLKDGVSIVAFSDRDDEMAGYESILFDHDFAKAFWGNKKGYWNVGSAVMDNVCSWQYRLQMLALQEDRIAYIERFLDKESFGNLLFT